MITKQPVAPPPEAPQEAPALASTLAAGDPRGGGYLGPSTRPASGYLGARLAKLFLLASCTADPASYLPFELGPDAGIDAEVIAAPARMPGRAMGGVLPVPSGDAGGVGGTMPAPVGGSGGVAVVIATGGTAGSSPAPKVRTYQVTPQGRLTWPEARAACEAEGRSLAMVTNADELARAVAAMDGRTYAWIGLSDAAAEGTWTWLAGTPATFAPWLAGQPNDNATGGEDCAALERRSDGSIGWADYPCDGPLAVRFAALCEQP